MSDIDPKPGGQDASADLSEANSEAQRAADGLKGQIAALRDQVRQARSDLLNTPRAERRSFKP
jgi:hypothetical protein